MAKWVAVPQFDGEGNISFYRVCREGGGICLPGTFSTKEEAEEEADRLNELENPKPTGPEPTEPEPTEPEPTGPEPTGPSM